MLTQKVDCFVNSNNICIFKWNAKEYLEKVLNMDLFNSRENIGIYIYKTVNDNTIPCTWKQFEENVIKKDEFVKIIIQNSYDEKFILYPTTEDQQFNIYVEFNLADDAYYSCATIIHEALNK